MSDVFIRSYELSIGSKQKMLELAVSPLLIRPSLRSGLSKGRLSPDKPSLGKYRDYLTVQPGETTLKIKDLQITADIKYLGSMSTNNDQTSTIKIYNIAPSRLKYIEDNGIVLLKAGYVQNAELPLVFTGQIETHHTRKQGQDQVTTLFCKDHHITLGNSRVSLHWGKPSKGKTLTYRDVLEDLIEEAKVRGVPLGGFYPHSKPLQPTQEALALNLDGFTGAALTVHKIDAPLPNGYNAEGKLLDEIQELCNDIDYRMYLSLGSLYVEPKTAPERVEVITLDNSQIKSIKPQNDSSTKSLSSKDKKKGVVVDMLLNGSVSLKTVVKIKEGEYKGSYKVDTVTHKLDYEGGSWDTSIKTTQGG